jgi:peptidoglycan/LPS O-acetylase OafA/YrhL
MFNYKNITHFEGLNSLRFFAAFLVVMHHAEAIRKKNDLLNFEWLGLFRNGGNAVTFFFVLSGFLITYLLLKEVEKTKTVNVKNFYLKRVYRIWPLYFLLFFIGTLLLPWLFDVFNINYTMPYLFKEVWFYFVFFLPGLVTFFFGHHFLEPLWSIGVEEVFYLIWAPLFKYGKNLILLMLLSIILIKFLLSVIGMYYFKNELFNYLINMFAFEAMSVGGLGAYFIFNSKKDLNQLFVYRKFFQFLIYFTLLIFLLFHSNIHHPIFNLVFKTPLWSGILLDFMFLYLIIGMSLIDHNLFKIKNKFLSFLGEISYGIYMYHMLIIFSIVLVFKNQIAKLDMFLGSVVFYAVLTVLVIVVSTLSKKYFEDYFLKLKSRLK